MIFKDPTFMVLAGAAIALMVFGAVVPPQGVIDGSILKAAGILLAFYAIGQIPEALRAGKEIKVKHGNTEVGIGDGADLRNTDNGNETD